MDSKTQAEEVFLEQMVIRYGDEKFTAADVFKLAEEIADVRDSVEGLMDRRLKDISALAIGKRLQKLRERIFECGRSLQQMEGRGRKVFYWIEGSDTTQGGGGEDGGSGEFDSATRKHFDFDFSTMT